jgi:hypothetical protein
VLAIAGLIVCLGVYEYRVAGMRGAFTVWRNERASVLVAKRVREITEPHAVVLSMFHSGSVRYYGGRVTMRYDLLDQQWLDRAIQWLSARGAHPYLLVNDWEIPQFVARFPSQQSVAFIRRPPLFTFQRAGMFLFDLAPPSDGPTEGAELTDGNEDLRSVPPAPAPQLAWQ